MRTQRTTAQSSYRLDLAVDGDRTPMPNEGMAAISRICSESSLMASAMAQAPRASLPLIVSGNNASTPGAAPRVNAENAKALEALGRLACDAVKEGVKEDVKEDGKTDEARASEPSPETPSALASEATSQSVPTQSQSSPSSPPPTVSTSISSHRRTHSAERPRPVDMALSDDFPDQEFDMVLTDEDFQNESAPAAQPSTSAPTPAPTNQP